MVCSVDDLRPGKPPERKLDGGEGHEAGQGFSEVLEILGETPVSFERGEGALDHPAARQNDEALMLSLCLTISDAQQRHLAPRGRRRLSHLFNLIAPLRAPPVPT